jgi:hypothetical protein
VRRKNIDYSESNTGLNLDVIEKILTFTDRKVFNNFRNTCHFFREQLDNRIYKKLPAPAIDYSSFSKNPPHEKNTIVLQRNGSRQFYNPHIQLSNGFLVIGNNRRVEKHNNATTIMTYVDVWQIEPGLLLSSIAFDTKDFSDYVSCFEEIKDNVLAIGFYNDYRFPFARVEFYDFNDPSKPSRLAGKILELQKFETNTFKREGVLDLALMSPGKLALITSIETTDLDGKPWGYTQLKLLQFDPENINDKSITIETISKPIANYILGHLIPLKNNQALIGTQKELHVYDLGSQDKSVPIKVIPLSADYHKILHKMLKLSDGRILTAYNKKTQDRYMPEVTLDVWDLTQYADKAHCKTILLSEQGICIFDLYQRINGELLIFTYVESEENTQLFRISVFNLQDEKLISSHDCKLPMGDNLRFIEDGRYLITDFMQTNRLIRFPLAHNQEKNEDRVKQRFGM